MEFPGFLGNAPVKEALSAAFAAGRFPHALLFQGEPGCGKRTFAKLTAQALVCRDKDHAPCGVCPACVRAKAGSHPDIRVVEGSGATRSLTVDQVKEITSDAYRAPEEADVSVYLLFLGSRTLEPAQNKLLKLIEEPPAHGVFILVCQSAEQLLPTIRSRVQSFLLQPPSQEEAAAYVAARENIPAQRARELASLCGGNIGRMLQELAGGEEAKAFSIAVAMVQGLLEPGEHSLLLAAAPLQKDRDLFREVLTPAGRGFPGWVCASRRRKYSAGRRPGTGGQFGGLAYETLGAAATPGGGVPPEAGPQRQYGPFGNGFLRPSAGSCGKVNGTGRIERRGFRMGTRLERRNARGGSHRRAF